MAERSPDTGIVRLDDHEGEEPNEATRVGELDRAQVQELMRQADVREATAVPALNAKLPSSGVVARRAAVPGARGSAPDVTNESDHRADTKRPPPPAEPVHGDARTVELGGDLVASVRRSVEPERSLSPARDTAGRVDSAMFAAAAPVQDDHAVAPFGGASEPPPRASMASLPMIAPSPASTNALKRTGSSGVGTSVGIGVAVFVAITLPALYYLFVR